MAGSWWCHTIFRDTMWYLKIWDSLNPPFKMVSFGWKQWFDRFVGLIIFTKKAIWCYTVSQMLNFFHLKIHLHPGKLTWNPKWRFGRWFSFSIGWFLGSMLIFMGVVLTTLWGLDRISQNRPLFLPWPSQSLQKLNQLSMENLCDLFLHGFT